MLYMFFFQATAGPKPVLLRVWAALKWPAGQARLDSAALALRRSDFLHPYLGILLKKVRFNLSILNEKIDKWTTDKIYFLGDCH